MNHKEVQGLRSRVRVLRDAMRRARFDYFSSLLALRTMQGNEDACNRIRRQLTNLLNEERANQRRSAKKA